MLAGRPHEAVGNGSPRWMAAGPLMRVHRTRPTGRLARRPHLAEQQRYGYEALWSCICSADCSEVGADSKLVGSRQVPGL
jgi:hypothetical protein